MIILYLLSRFVLCFAAISLCSLLPTAATADTLPSPCVKVKPICVAHKWNVKFLEEFIPPNPGLLGMNVNRQKIFIRLRPHSDVGKGLEQYQLPTEVYDGYNPPLPIQQTITSLR